MDSKVNYNKSIFLAALGLALSFVFSVSSLGFISLLIGIIYAALAINTNTRISLGLYLLSLGLITIFLDEKIVIDLCIGTMIPAFFIGKLIKKNMEGLVRLKNSTTKNIVIDFMPFLNGIIIYMISILVLYIVYQVAFNIDVVLEIENALKQTFKETFKLLSVDQVEKLKTIGLDTEFTYFRKILPMTLAIRAIFMSFITYAGSVFVSRKLYKTKVEVIKFKNFFLPGKPVIIILLGMLLVMGIGAIYPEVNSIDIVYNIQAVMSVLFIIQGIAVCVYAFPIWSKNGESWRVIVTVAVVVLFGFISGLSLLGMVDTVINIRLRIDTKKSVK